ncbi:P-loop containing nucleoside triphosphate hydrolase protein [Atractiella rhizophila]|nr:P-loop containing nucleoside triphosphate hydrolase protein [Atractiella rhizophila]
MELQVGAFRAVIPIFSIPLLALVVATAVKHLPRPPILRPFVSPHSLPPELQPGYPTFTPRRAALWKVLVVFLALLFNAALHAHAIALHWNVEDGQKERVAMDDAAAVVVYLVEVLYLVFSLPLVQLPWSIFFALTLQCFLETQERIPVLILALVVLATLPFQPFSAPVSSATVIKTEGDSKVPTNKRCAGEDYRTLWDYSFVFWFSPLVSYSFKAGSLNPSDVPPLTGTLRHSSLTQAWETTPATSSNDRRLIFRLLHANRLTIIHGTLFRITATSLNFASPYFLQKILEELSREEPDRRFALKCAFYALAFGAAKSVVANWFMEETRRTVVHGQSLLRGQIYKKALRRKDTSAVTTGGKGQSSLGKTINLMAADSDRASATAYFALILLEAPVFITIGVVYLYNLLGYSALLGALFAFVSAGASKLVMAKYQSLVDKSNKAKDERMTKTNELIQSIRHLKWFAWEDEQAKKVMAVREKELGVIFSMKIWNGIMGVFWGLTMPGILFISFLGFVKLQGQELTVPVSFTAFVIFNMLELPVFMLSQGLMYMIMMYASVPRIEAFLKEEEVDSDLEKTTQGSVGFKNASFEYEKEGRFKLIDLNVEFKEGLNLVVGVSGSGKTSLLLALLGELRQIEGERFLPRYNEPLNPETGLYNGTAYASQTPWLQHATIRDDILFGNEYEEKRYKEVLKACALEKDLEILPSGDLSEIGEKGISLSGGQKARVSLARAFYSRSRILLCDDPISAVDTHVASTIVKSFDSPLMNGRTIILVTHAVDLCLPLAAFLVTMSEGRIILEENVENMKKVDDAKGKLQDVLKNEESIDKAVHDVSSVDDAKTAGEIAKKAGKLVEEEKKSQGSIAWSVYHAYVKAAGYWMWAIVLVCLFARVWSETAVQYFLKIWGEAYGPVDETTSSAILVQAKRWIDSSSFATSRSGPWGLPDPRENVNPYLLVLLGIDMFVAFANLIAEVMLALLGMRTSRNMFESTLNKFIRGTLRWYDTTPTGRILNRFSADFTTMDDALLNFLQRFIINLVDYLRCIVVVVVIVPWFIIPIFIMLFIFRAISVRYLATSLELKRLESVNKSPIISQFGETLAGLSTIRAFRAESRFTEELEGKIDTYLAMHYNLWAGQRWVQIRFELAGLVAVFVGTALTIHGEVSPGFAAMVITSAVSLAASTEGVMKSFADVEVNFNAVERIQELQTIPSEPPTVVDTRRPPAWWPSDKGGIEIEELRVSYATDTPEVLKGISVSIGAKEKVGVVGRTGSGKSTLASVLMRAMEPLGGRILIDGIDITSIGTHDLRNQITLIPQDPAIFSGTIRSNIDPFEAHSDEECWSAIERVQLTSSRSHQASGAATPSGSTVSSTVVGEEDMTKSKRLHITSLEDLVAANGANLSAGQRQLLSLARALLRSSRIVILDEATSSVDRESDGKIQETLKIAFTSSIVLSIAHRLETVIEFDKILVLDEGRVVEFDTPAMLLKKENGVFKDMWMKRK